MSASLDDSDPPERRQARATEVTKAARRPLPHRTATFCGVIINEDGPRTLIKWGSRAHYMATILVWMAQRAYTPSTHQSLGDCDSLFEKFGIGSAQSPYTTEVTEALQLSLVQYVNETVWSDLRTNHVVSGNGWDPRAKVAWARRDWDGRDISLSHLNKVLPVATPLEKDKGKAPATVAHDHKSLKENYDAARRKLSNLQSQFQQHFEEQRSQFVFYRQDHDHCKKLYKQHASRYKDMVAEYLSKTETMLRTWEETYFATITSEMFQSNS